MSATQTRTWKGVRLSHFIRTDSERILAEFESFAREIDPIESMDPGELRDHAAQMLEVIAQDLDRSQTAEQAEDKAKGRADANGLGRDTPAQYHGSGRAASGFTMAEMVSEYRALRASVTRLWIASKGELSETDLEDLIRFNEAIDQALAESTERFMTELDRTRETFLGVLGHDLRTPLGAIITSAKFLLDLGELSPTARTLTSAIVSSGIRMNSMVMDLLDFTRGRLGMSIPVELGRVDLAQVLATSVQEALAAHPGVDLRLETESELFGNWDSSRLSQVMSNLITNAINHGSSGTQVTINAQGNADDVVFSIHNFGPAIPVDEIEDIFDPLTSSPPRPSTSHHLGLGLYIVRDVVAAHGGSIEVKSSEAEGTTFTVCLPRRSRLAP